MPEEEKKDKQDRMIELLEQMVKWVKFSGMKEVKDTLVSVLNTEVKKLAYHLSDGSRGTVEVAELAGIGSTRTIFDMWQAWLKLGLGESIPVRGGSRFKRSFDLRDLGIEIPQSKRVENEEKQAAEPATTEKTEVSEQSQEESYA